MGPRLRHLRALEVLLREARGVPRRALARRAGARERRRRSERSAPRSAPPGPRAPRRARGAPRWMAATSSSPSSPVGGPDAAPEVGEAMRVERRRLRADALASAVAGARAACIRLARLLARGQLCGAARRADRAARARISAGIAGGPEWQARASRSSKRCAARFPPTSRSRSAISSCSCAVSWRRTSSVPLGGSGGGVQVLDATEARGRSFERLFVIGLARDVFPRSVREDPLLPDALRERVRDVLPEVPVKKLGLDEERFLFAELARFGSARHALVAARVRRGTALRPLELRRAPALGRRVREGRASRGPCSRRRPLDRRQRLGLEEHLLRAALFGPAQPPRGGLPDRLARDRGRDPRRGEPASAADSLAAARLAVLREMEGKAFRAAPQLGPYFGFVGRQRAANDPRAARLYVTTLERLVALRLADLPRAAAAPRGAPRCRRRAAGNRHAAARLGGPPRDRRGLPRRRRRRPGARAPRAGPTTRGSRRSRPRPRARFSRRRAFRSGASRACSRSGRFRSWCARAVSTRPSRSRSRSWPSSASAASTSPTRAAARTRSTSGPIASNASAGASGSRTSRPESRSRTGSRRTRAAKHFIAAVASGKVLQPVAYARSTPGGGEGPAVVPAAGSRGRRGGVLGAAGRRGSRQAPSTRRCTGSSTPGTRGASSRACSAPIWRRSRTPAGAATSHRRACAATRARVGVSPPGSRQAEAGGERSSPAPSARCWACFDWARRRTPKRRTPRERSGEGGSPCAAPTRRSPRPPSASSTARSSSRPARAPARRPCWSRAVSPGRSVPAGSSPRSGSAPATSMGSPPRCSRASPRSPSRRPRPRRWRTGSARCSRRSPPASCATASTPERWSSPGPLREARARALLGALDRWVVRTIHAFCRRLLAQHPLAAGLHPEFEVDADERVASAVAREVVEAAVREGYGEPGDPDLIALGVEGVGPAELEEALVAFLAGGGGRAARSSRPSSRRSSSRPSLEELRAALDRFAAADGGRPRTTCRSARDARMRSGAIAATVDALSALRRATSTALDALAEALRGHWSEGRARAPPRVVRARGLQSPRRRRSSGRRRARGGGSRRGALRARSSGLVPLRPLRLERARRVLHALARARPREAARARSDRIRIAAARGARSAARPAGGARARSLRLRSAAGRRVPGHRPGAVRHRAPARARRAMPDRGRVSSSSATPSNRSTAGARPICAPTPRWSRDALGPGGAPALLCVNRRSVPAILDEVERVIEPAMTAGGADQAAFQPLVASEKREREALAARAAARVRGALDHAGRGTRRPDRPRLPRAGEAAKLEAEAVARDLARARSRRTASSGSTPAC